MRLHLQKDSRVIREYIRQRALEHGAASHHGPGKKRDPISQISTRNLNRMPERIGF